MQLFSILICSSYLVQEDGVGEEEEGKVVVEAMEGGGKGKEVDGEGIIGGQGEEDGEGEVDGVEYTHIM